MIPVKAEHLEEAPPPPPDAWAEAARMQPHRADDAISVKSYRSVETEGEDKSWAEQCHEEEAWPVPNHKGASWDGWAANNKGRSSQYPH